MITLFIAASSLQNTSGTGETSNMSRQWPGRVCWTVAAALLVHQASANPAIIVRKTEAGYYDVSLKITHLDLMPGVTDWDSLAFTSLNEPTFSEYDGSLDIDVWEKLAVLDMASGKLCQFTDGCMDDIAWYYQSMCDEEASQQRRLEKRYSSTVATT
jgi:hypothetical protein